MEKENSSIKAVITGATGMVGDGVLMECLNHPNVTEVLVIGRKKCGRVHPKMKEIVHSDMFDISLIADQLSGYNACFFCLGTTSVGKTEEEYNRITTILAVDFAKVLLQKNSAMTFCFVSGAGTDGTEKSKTMWARVKGKAENELMKLPFKKVFCFRPGFMDPSEGQNNVHSGYKYLGWIYPAARKIFPKYFSTMKEVALAMIHSVLYGYEKQVLEVSDMVELAKRG